MDLGERRQAGTQVLRYPLPCENRISWIFRAGISSENPEGASWLEIPGPTSGCISSRKRPQTAHKSGPQTRRGRWRRSWWAWASGAAASGP